MFTSEYEIAMDDEPDCEDCGRQLQWEECKQCGGTSPMLKTWGRDQGLVWCPHCSHGGNYVCRHCDKQPKVEAGQMALFEV